MSESLRDQLAANLDKITTVETPEETPVAATPSGGDGAAPESKVSELKEDKTGRLHGDGGKFVPKKDTAAAPEKPQPTTTPTVVPASAAAPKPQRPSSWKKDFWGHWDKLTAGQQLAPEEALALAQYMNEREAQFQHGVSTYKTEWDNARPIMEAMQPYLPLLQQHGIAPNTWISNLGAAHRELALGTPQQKLARFAWLAQQYGLPLEALTNEQVRGQYLQSQPQTQNLNPPSQGLSLDEARRLFHQEFTAQQSQQEVERFKSDQEKYPHFEALKETMAQLLEANLAENLQSAYDAALRHPRHSDLWQQLQEQERARSEEEKRRAEAERISKAKGKAVSTRSATPTPTQPGSPKDRRSSIEEAFDSVMGSARV